jgi:hypothetical protein
LRPLYELQIAELFSNLRSSRATEGSVAIPEIAASSRPGVGTPRNDGRSGSKYDQVFTSCNIGHGKSWCGHCPKCAFAYISLFPFMDDYRLKGIFGSDLFEQPEIQQHVLDLVGLGPHKPFDCVGTKEESVVAIALAINKYQKNNKPIPYFLLSLRKKLRFTDKDIKRASDTLMKSWSSENFLPPKYAKLLKERIFQLKT